MSDLVPWLDNDVFIRNVFRVMLGRAPRDAELADWRWGLHQGQTRAQMIGVMSTSAEFASILARPPSRAAMGGFSTEIIQSLIRWSLDNTTSGRGGHITRFSMYRALHDQLAAHDGAAKTVLAISGSTRLGQDVLGLRAAAYVEADYPGVDLLRLPYADASFDFCVSDQVLEHLEGDPFVAFAESVRVVKPGGFICHTTCFINHVHQDPRDFWRFTPDALELLATHAGCENIAAAGWGNREAWALIEAGFRFAPIPLDETHPLYGIATHNEPEWPISVWVTARKPA